MPFKRFSALAGGLALGIMMVPLIARTTEELLKLGLIDGVVNGVGWLARSAGGVLRQLQSGNIRSYATWILFGSVVAIVAMFIAGTLPLGVVQ